MQGTGGGPHPDPPPTGGGGPVVLVLGPTGIGKSRAAFELALALGGEVVVCDSRQVYGWLDIATNKPSPEDMRRVRSHPVGVAAPRPPFTPFEFLPAARPAVSRLA